MILVAVRDDAYALQFRCLPESRILPKIARYKSESESTIGWTLTFSLQGEIRTKGEGNVLKRWVRVDFWPAIVRILQG